MDECAWAKLPARAIPAIFLPMLQRVDNPHPVVILRAPEPGAARGSGWGNRGITVVDGIWPRAILPAPCFGPMRP